MISLISLVSSTLSCGNSSLPEESDAGVAQTDTSSSGFWGLFEFGNEEAETLTRIKIGGLSNVLPRQCAEKPFVLAGVRRNGLDLVLASAELRNDPEVVMAAVSQNGLALQYASLALRANPDIVLAAVRQNGLALLYAAHSISRLGEHYVEIALAAVENNWHSFDNVVEYYRGNMDIALAAMAQNTNAIYLVSPSLFSNQEFVRQCYNLSFGAYYYIYQTMFSMANTSLLPQELNASLQSTLTDLTNLNIRHMERFTAATPSEVAEIVTNRRALDSGGSFADGRPVALVVLPVIDRTDTFIHNNISQLIQHGYRVVYFEAESDLEVYEAIEATGQRQLISLLYLGGHGTARTTRFSGEPYEDDEILFLDPSDEAEMYYLNNYLAENSRVLLYGCYACNGELEGMLECVFPDSTFFVPDGTPQGFDMVFDNQNSLVDVDFFTN